MKPQLLFKKIKCFTVRCRTIPPFGIFLLIFISVQAQKADIVVPASQVKLIKTFKLNSTTRVESPAVVDPNAIYSNINDANFAGDVFYNNGATLQTGNTITTLVADSLGLVGTPPFTIGKVTFSVANANDVDVSVRPRIRIYANDGPAGGPGGLLAGFTIPAISFGTGSLTIYTVNVTPFPIPTQAIWAGITFDNDTATSGATLAQLNNFGQAVLNPIDRGSSTDDVFITNTAGSFLGDDPAGSLGNLGGTPLANLAWEIVTSAPVPVTLSNLNAQRNGQINTLTWNTSQELNSNYFAIERSVDGIHFTQIGQVKAGGNSSVARSYHFDDAKPDKGINYYRLHMVDIDNVGKYSNIVTVKNTGSINLTIYPNPAKNTILVNIDAEKAEMAGISITDMNGRKVYNRQVTVTQGNNNFSLDVINFSKGTYFIKIQLSTGSYTNKFDKL